MNVGVGNRSDRDDVQPDDHVFVVKKDHTELLPVGLAAGLYQLADDGLGLSGVGQCAGLEGKVLISNEHDTVGGDELGSGRIWFRGFE